MSLQLTLRAMTGDLLARKNKSFSLSNAVKAFSVRSQIGGFPAGLVLGNRWGTFLAWFAVREMEPALNSARGSIETANTRAERSTETDCGMVEGERKNCGGAGVKRVLTSLLQRSYLSIPGLANPPI